MISLLDLAVVLVSGSRYANIIVASIDLETTCIHGLRAFKVNHIYIYVPSEMLDACASSDRDLRCGLGSSAATAIIFGTVLLQISFISLTASL